MSAANMGFAIVCLTEVIEHLEFPTLDSCPHEPNIRGTTYKVQHDDEDGPSFVPWSVLWPTKSALCIAVKTPTIGRRKDEAEKLLLILGQEFSGSAVNFDLEDCDRILRIESQHLCSGKVVALVVSKGYFCEILI